MKKYVLFVPESGLSKGQLKELAQADKSLVYLIDHDGRILEGKNDYPDFVLKEIKDEPLSQFDVAMSVFPDSKASIHDSYIRQFTWGEGLELVKAGEENNEKRHRPQQTLEEYAKTRTHGFTMSPAEAWQASERNRGFE